MAELSAEDKVIRAKVQLYTRSPFFAYLLLYMKIQKAPPEMFGKEKGTMAVDAKGNLYYDEKFVEELTEEELMGVLAHEVFHVALLHLTRGRGRDHEVMNVANDMCANDCLITESFTLPKCGILPRNHEFVLQLGGNKQYLVTDIDKKSSEELYDEIQTQLHKNGTKVGKGKPGNGPGNGNGLPGGFDQHEYSEGDSDSEEAKQNEQNWKARITEGAVLAKQQGKLPAMMERMIDSLLDTKVDWRYHLYKYITDSIPFDFMWSKPGKRSEGAGCYLPSLKRECAQIVVAVDTSGSIGQAELKEFLTEIAAIGTAFENVEMTIIICDADIHETYTLTKDNVDEICAMKCSGGGGTSHQPVFNWIKENMQGVKVLVGLTDGCSDINSIDPVAEDIYYDVLWVIPKYGTTDLKWGQVIKMEE